MTDNKDYGQKAEVTTAVQRRETQMKKMTLISVLAVLVAMVMAASASAGGSPTLTLSVSPNPAQPGQEITASGTLTKHDGHAIKYQWVEVAAFAGADCDDEGFIGSDYDQTDHDGAYSVGETIPADFPTGTYSVQSYSYVSGHWVASDCVNVAVQEQITEAQVNRDGACASSPVLRVGDNSLGTFVDLDMGTFNSGTFSGVKFTPAPFVVGLGQTCDVAGHTFTGNYVTGDGTPDEAAPQFNTHPLYK